MLQNLKKAWPAKRPIFWSFAAFILSLLIITNAQAQNAAIQRMTYSVYASGINALEADMVLDMSEQGHYALMTTAYTRGFLGAIVPWRGTFDSHGWITDNKEKPYQVELHESYSLWRGEGELKEYKYNKDGTFKGLTITEHEKPTRKEEVDEVLTEGSTDILTAVLTSLHQIEEGKSCDSTSSVFDGKRKYNLLIKQKNIEELSASRYNIFSGNAHRCTVEVVPDGGAWHKKPRGWFSIQEQGRKKGTMPTVWMGTMTQGQPAIPVKIMVKTNYGALMMHLIGYEFGDTKIVLKD